YHRLMLQIALWIHAIDASCFSRTALQNLARATHWLRSLTDPHSGQVPNLGSNDGANFLLLTSCPHSDFRPTVQAAARAFLRERLPYQGPWDELSLWLNLIDQNEAEDADLGATHLSYMGASDVIHGRHSWGYLRATSFRSPLAHSDQLHFDLWWQGFNLARDAGSGYYNLPAPWDNPLTAARVHNIVTVDGKEPRQRLTRFLSLGWKPSWAAPLIPENGEILAGLEARYRGYAGIRHTRRVWVYADEHWEVQDELSSHRPSAVHSYRLHWLLADGEWMLEPHDQGGLLQVTLPIGILQVKVEASAAVRILLIRAGKVIWGEGLSLPYEGWFSPTYGLLEPALSFSLELQVSGSASFLTHFS
ncbi:MAG: heparinase II/III family protein, partial [Anaerolineales bacterium]